MKNALIAGGGGGTEEVDTGFGGVIELGVRIRGTLGDLDPLNKVPFKRATSRVQKGPL